MKTITIILFIALGALLIGTPVLADFSYSNIMESGSSFTGSKGAFTSSIGSRFVGDSSPETGYTMQISNGIGTASSYFRGNLMEGRNGATYPSSSLSFSQRTTASGIIYGFSASYSWNSKITA